MTLKQDTWWGTYLLVESLGRRVLVLCDHRRAASRLRLVDICDAERAVIHDVEAGRHDTGTMKLRDVVSLRMYMSGIYSPKSL